MPPVRLEQTADKSNFALFAEEAERNRTGAGVRANDGADGVDADVHLRQLLHQHLAQLLGTSNAYVTYLIYGDRRDGAWVARICEVLDMPTHGEDGPELTGFARARKGSGAAGDSVVQ